MTTQQPVHAVGRLSASDRAAVLALAEAAAAADGVYPLSEDVVLRVRGAGPGTDVHLLAWAEDGLAGYAYVDPGDDEGPSAELVVHPRYRRRGYGTALLAAATAENRSVRFWAHGDEPDARAFAAKNGLVRVRVLWQMRRPLDTPLPERPLPPGVTFRSFRVGHDEAAWLGVNARAFAHHAEQGRWTLDDLRAREAEPWFDPAGFLLAVDVGDAVLGFHWTKVHPPAGDDPALGEVYVLGVDPGGHRKGLGAALTVAGLRHLASVGLGQAMLYVDDSNAAAASLYRGLGFTVYASDVSYQAAK